MLACATKLEKVMSDGQSGFRYYPVPQESLDLLKEYDEAIQQYQAARQALIAEFQQRMMELAQGNAVNLEKLWERLSSAVGLDPAMTWKNPAYQIETRYLGSGFGAITFVPQDASLDQIMGREGSEAIETPPEGTKLH